MSNLASYLRQVNQAINNEDGTQLIELFKTDGPALAVIMQARAGLPPAGQVLNQCVSKQWGGIVYSFLQTLALLCEGKTLAACEEFRENHAKVIQGLISDQVWVLPVVISTANSLRNLSMQADADVAKRGGSTATNGQLSKCAMFLQTVFAKTAASKGQDAEIKKAGSVAIACIMIKVQFRLNTLTNCKQIISRIEGPLNVFEGAQMAHKVTYRYYTGRLLAYDEDYLTAEKHLSFAFTNCQTSALNNKRKILRYLIPVRMLLGVLPTDQLLQDSGLTEYRDIAHAVRAGDVRLLMQALDTHQVALVQAGVYLLLEKLQLAVYRRLFKKCALLHAANNPAKATQVPIDMFTCALKLQDIEKDDVEIQCLLANLVYRKFIKGYIAYKQRVVVLAKTDPFPPLETVQLGDPFG